MFNLNDQHDRLMLFMSFNCTDEIRHEGRSSCELDDSIDFREEWMEASLKQSAVVLLKFLN